MADTRLLMLRVYNHEVSQHARIRVNGSLFWTAQLWASVMRNPFPKRSEWTDAKEWSLRINPWTPEEFQEEVAGELAPEAAAKGLTVRQQVNCHTPLYNPRLDIGLFRDEECVLIYECKWVAELRPGEALQALTYKTLFSKDVVLAVPTRAEVTTTAASMLRAAEIPIRRFGKEVASPDVDDDLPPIRSVLGGPQTGPTRTSRLALRPRAKK